MRGTALLAVVCLLLATPSLAVVSLSDCAGYLTTPPITEELKFAAQVSCAEIVLGTACDGSPQDALCDPAEQFSGPILALILHGDVSDAVVLAVL